ncbi:hypothetical protein [Belliella pelovolcani]|uniref:hypothetical protein n=1 Tax=Belliella pelovolcani TaxID=529505 RepID=UPI00391B632D
MKNLKLFVALYFILILPACDTDSDIVFENPQFSPTMIQSIDADGVVFSADVFDLGKLSIEEYGFFYASTNQPRDNNSEKLSFTGTPNGSFTAEAEHSLTKNGLYYVIAYIKTSKGFVFSDVVRFKSEGSKGFNVQSIEIPSNLYFQDTITVRGSNFSRLISKYQVSVGNTTGIVVEATNDYFKFLFPGYLSYMASGPFETANISVKILDRVQNFNEPINFREPEFIANPEIVYNINDEVEIKGNYLLSRNISISILDGDDRTINVTPTSTTGSSIKFIRDFEILTDNPVVSITLRGKNYQRSDLFTLSKN